MDTGHNQISTRVSESRTYGFRPGVAERLGFYVYLLLDPRSTPAVIFYVGKGVGERCFQHIVAARRSSGERVSDFEKLARIRAIESDGKATRIEILRHGMDAATALAVESAAIELLGLDELANVVAGHGTASVGRTAVEDLNFAYGARPAVIDPLHPVVIIRLNRLPDGDDVHDEIYQRTRKWWRVAANRRKAETPGAPRWALAVFRGVVRAVYRIKGWEFPSADVVVEDPRRKERCAFIGERDPDMEARYLATDVSAYLPPNAQNPLLYVNC